MAAGGALVPAAGGMPAAGDMALADDGIAVVADAGIAVLAGGGVVDGGVVAAVAADGLADSSPDGAFLLQAEMASAHAMTADNVLTVMGDLLSRSSRS